LENTQQIPCEFVEATSCDNLFPNRARPEPYNFGAPAEDEWLVDSITAHRWSGNMIEFHVPWNLGDTTWDSEITECIGIAWHETVAAAVQKDSMKNRVRGMVQQR
jgi:hypothetical protein